jgi:hypothetical protein
MVCVDAEEASRIKAIVDFEVSENKGSPDWTMTRRYSAMTKILAIVWRMDSWSLVTRGVPKTWLEQQL